MKIRMKDAPPQVNLRSTPWVPSVVSKTCSLPPIQSKSLIQKLNEKSPSSLGAFAIKNLHSVSTPPILTSILTLVPLVFQAFPITPVFVFNIPVVEVEFPLGKMLVRLLLNVFPDVSLNCQYASSPSRLNGGGGWLVWTWSDVVTVSVIVTLNICAEIRVTLSPPPVPAISSITPHTAPFPELYKVAISEAVSL